jgi:hypothetical protein
MPANTAVSSASYAAAAINRVRRSVELIRCEDDRRERGEIERHAR